MRARPVILFYTVVILLYFNGPLAYTNILEYAGLNLPIFSRLVDMGGMIALTFVL